MTEFDRLMLRLGSLAVPDRLMALDGATLAALARSRSAETRSIGTVAATAALLLGFAGGLPVAPAAGARVVPLGLASPLAPSALLAG